MYFMSSFNKPLLVPKSTSNKVVKVNKQSINQSSNLRDMFHAIRTGSTSCKSCGRG